MRKLFDFFEAFKTWTDHRKQIGEDQDSWTYEQGRQDAEYYFYMLDCWEILNENA